MKKGLIFGWFVSFLLLFSSTCFSLTAEEVMEAVIENIKGPSGMAVVASGKMKTPAKESDLFLMRYVAADQLIEVVQTDLFKPGESGGDANWKYKIFWEKDKVHQLIYLPSIRRQRIPPTDLLDGVYDSRYPYGLLPIFGVLMDFTYPVIHQQGKQFVVRAVRKPGSSSPFPIAEFTIGTRETTMVIEKARYTTDREETIIQVFEEYKEVKNASGYFAPYKVSAANTIFTFIRWSAIDPPSWILSRLNIGMHNIPKP